MAFLIGGLILFLEPGAEQCEKEAFSIVAGCVPLKRSCVSVNIVYIVLGYSLRILQKNLFLITKKSLL